MAVQAILNLLTLITRLILYIISFNAAISSPEIKKRLTSLLRQPHRLITDEKKLDRHKYQPFKFFHILVE
jgi:hypothetical protein